MAVDNELPGMAVPAPRTDPALLEAELFGLEETLNILRDEFTSVAPNERVHVARHMRDTRVRIARIRMQLVHGYPA
ncbi:hypothetical protein [Nocardioides panzhihuensis]|uniref:Uncharacterized protein n=1 Tax=Nocardioides panzhihuensis TaxID=860243 RepID=A0A7Z0ISJ4_9ACTN|nr:hypothetical protein [Nocardioides panzhihuensis]NYI78006.1 hypothetical protein [Nocardioides panzhihuensis]